MLEIETVGNHADLHRITAQHLDLGALDAVMVMDAGQVACSSYAGSGAMVKELDMHLNLLRVAALLAGQ